MSYRELKRVPGHLFGHQPPRHHERSAIFCADAKDTRSSPRLLDVAIAAASAAHHLELSIFAGRGSVECRWFEIWPGEHYRLLAALVRILSPKIVVEIGTFTGMGALALAQEIGAGHVHSFDLVPWQSIASTWLQADDFRNITQHLADLGEPAVFRRYADLLSAADLIFVDGPKDRRFEPAFITQLGQLTTKSNLVVVFDDVRQLAMLKPWWEMKRPKLDLTSFGHWSGTGLVDWNG